MKIMLSLMVEPAFEVIQVRGAGQQRSLRLHRVPLKELVQ